MPPAVFRLVLDTNTIVRAFISLESSCGRILRACEARRAVPLLSRAVLSEYRAVIKRPSLLDRYPELKQPDIGVSLERLLYVSDFYRRVDEPFAFQRDPKDVAFLELAIAGHATHLITSDHDLLSLVNGRDEAAKRFRRRVPKVVILKPEEFVNFHADILSNI